jgi:hypothetical protein
MEQYFDIGHGLIASSSPIRDHLLVHNGRAYVRFLDYLGVPSQLDHLSIEQLIALNRKREQLLHSGALQASTARFVFESLVQLVEPTSILEIGPGRSPISIGDLQCKNSQDSDYP